ncbi:ABC transporter substrate-binding protein [Actinomadura syzygii]|uniref:ABC transporter substrate-binding protein n=1 Tax=Actinomadura syzygii TaxID=1427538 RepID=A0A5D0U545_9ACTN|nr:ABC transporter substrate-binding protein [Actinomadura syzygii]TYC13187.1 ABC transporter substrate-binding protein [Actinomadura syzygii]
MGVSVSRGRTWGRLLAAGALATALSVSLVACGDDGGGTAKPGANGGKPEKASITVTYGSDSASTAPLWIAADEGFFAKHGLTVKVVHGTSSVGAIATVSGAADIFLGEATTSFQAVSRNQPLEIVGALRKLSDFKLYVRPDITNVEQLKGKKVAISAAGDSSDMATRQAFTELKSSTDGMTLLPTGNSSNRVAALTTGRVSATLLTEPSATKAKKAGMREMLDQTDKPFLGSGITIANKFGKSNPNTVVAFIESLVDSIHWLQDKANKDAAMKVISKWQAKPIDDPDVVRGYNTYSTPGELQMDPTPDAAAGQAMVTGLKAMDAKAYANLELDKVYNLTFVKAIEDSGYLTKVWGDKLKS